MNRISLSLKDGQFHLEVDCPLYNAAYLVETLLRTQIRPLTETCITEPTIDLAEDEDDDDDNE
jgi:hypothetical protein